MRFGLGLSKAGLQKVPRRHGGISIVGLLLMAMGHRLDVKRSASSNQKKGENRQGFTQLFSDPGKNPLDSFFGEDHLVGQPPKKRKKGAAEQLSLCTGGCRLLGVLHHGLPLFYSYGDKHQEIRHKK